MFLLLLALLTVLTQNHCDAKLPTCIPLDLETHTVEAECKALLNCQKRYFASLSQARHVCKKVNKASRLGTSGKDTTRIQ